MSLLPKPRRLILVVVIAVVAAAARKRALHGQRLSPSDLEELWAALTEEALRRGSQSLDGKWNPQAVRQETENVIARLRTKVEGALRES